MRIAHKSKKAPKPKKEKEKMQLHPRNLHQGKYDMKVLVKANPELANHIILNPNTEETINFFNPQSVKALNTALLAHYYGVKKWNIPEGYLCPPIPGRADYIHYLADLLAESYGGALPAGHQVTCLDMGVGANCVYPLIGHKAYGWSFIGADIDPIALKNAEAIIKANPKLKGKIQFRLQPDPMHTILNVLAKDERVELMVCNPPFHGDMESAEKGSLRKLENLTGETLEKPVLNFGGNPMELCCPGGEARFIQDMIQESRWFPTNCFWYSTLISKYEHVELAHKALHKVKAADVRTIKMGQGNKISRIVAWTFLSANQREKWVESRKS